MSDSGGGHSQGEPSSLFSVHVVFHDALPNYYGVTLDHTVVLKPNHNGVAKSALCPRARVCMWWELTVCRVSRFAATAALGLAGQAEPNSRRL